MAFRIDARATDLHLVQLGGLLIEFGFLGVPAGGEVLPHSADGRGESLERGAGIAAITARLSHGRRELVLMSAERYDWLLAAAKRSHAVEELPGTVVEAVRSARMSGRHKHLDKLMK